MRSTIPDDSDAGPENRDYRIGVCIESVESRSSSLTRDSLFMRITEIYADDVGATHIRDVPVALAPRDYAPPSAPMGVSPETPLTTGVILELPPGWDPLYHATPRRQWVVVLRGRLNITVTDGAAADLQAGDVFFLNDENSKGHRSLVQGQQPVALFLVGLADH